MFFVVPVKCDNNETARSILNKYHMIIDSYGNIDYILDKK